MKVSHVLYKVDDLNKTVEEFRKKGFTVEYGKRDKPYNALIYFEQGPYIELIQNMNMPKWVQVPLRLFGHKGFVDSMISQNRAEEGYIRLAFDAPLSEFQTIQQQLKVQNYPSIVAPVKRKDFYQNQLKCKCIFPYESKLPFIKSPFETERELVHQHQNQVNGIKKITYSVTPDQFNIVKSMNTDPIVSITEGNFEINVEF